MPQTSSHILQPKHTLLKQEETEKILDKFNISLIQLPKIKITDPALPKGANVGDVIKIERKDDNGAHVYYRAVVL
jgi:DNA-directed RNA polymerase subunit H